MGTRVLHLPRTVGLDWKIEAPGCVVWLSATADGGTRVDIEADGQRYGEEQHATVRLDRGRLVVEDKEHVRVDVIPRNCLHPRSERSHIKPGNYRCLSCGFQQFEPTGA